MAKEATKTALAIEQPVQQPEHPPEQPPTVSHADIAVLAFQLWEGRGCPEGSGEEDWYEAERRLAARTE